MSIGAPPRADLVIAQGGGPTAVVNASLVGALRAAVGDPRVGRVLGARYGVEGLVSGDWVDLADLSAAEATALERTPGASLGSSRHRPPDDEIQQTVAALRRQNVRWVLLIGGNDTADTLHRFHEAAAALSAPIAFVGIPKTIDNDLPHMDHAPGYGSAARYIAAAVQEAALDTAAMRKTDPVKIVEVMGRNAGWLAAASTLGRGSPTDAPHVVFLPERPLSLDRMLSTIRDAYEAHGWAIVVLSENQRDDAGEPLGGRDPVYVDPHGHPYFESAGAALARGAQRIAGIRTRYERPGSLQRTSAATLSQVDVSEAVAVGAEAARLALSGVADVMVAIQREPGPDYRIHLTTVPLVAIAHQERLMPDDMIAPSGTDVTETFLAYARPLIGPPLPGLRRPFV